MVVLSKQKFSIDSNILFELMELYILELIFMSSSTLKFVENVNGFRTWVSDNSSGSSYVPIRRSGDAVPGRSDKRAYYKKKMMSAVYDVDNLVRGVDDLVCVTFNSPSSAVIGRSSYVDFRVVWRTFSKSISRLSQLDGVTCDVLVEYVDRGGVNNVEHGHGFVFLPGGCDRVVVYKRRDVRLLDLVRELWLAALFKHYGEFSLRGNAVFHVGSIVDGTRLGSGMANWLGYVTKTADQYEGKVGGHFQNLKKPSDVRSGGQLFTAGGLKRHDVMEFPFEIDDDVVEYLAGEGHILGGSDEDYQSVVYWLGTLSRDELESVVRGIIEFLKARRDAERVVVPARSNADEHSSEARRLGRAAALKPGIDVGLMDRDEALKIVGDSRLLV